MDALLLMMLCRPLVLMHWLSSTMTGSNSTGGYCRCWCMESSMASHNLTADGQYRLHARSVPTLQGMVLPGHSFP
jgi:hypothetical protein